MGNCSGKHSNTLHTERMIWASLLAIAISACAPDPSESNATTEAAPARINFAAEPAGDWTAYTPRGETRCSDGSPYKFYVRAGDPDKLLLYLQGGGACWFRENCDPAMEPTYTQTIPAGFKPLDFGIFNPRNPANPFKDHTAVFAPYCTGDVHIGASDTVYPPVTEDQMPLTIYHRGRANMQAILDWIAANVTPPEEIFVTGSSAGAIPSPFYAAKVADLYPRARIAHLGDGAGGYRRINNDSRPDEQWGTFTFLNSEPGFENVTADGFNYEQLYIAAASAHPDVLFAEYDAAEDAVQKRFLALSGAEDVALLDSLQANHSDIRAAVSNFRAYIAGGESHTILHRPEFYTYASNGVSIRDWVARLSRFETVDDVTCASCETESYAGGPIPESMQTLWNTWEDPKQQYVEPFQIFDNIYYVGIDWVAAYVLQTSNGLILIDSLYGKWVRQLVNNIDSLGLDPANIKYVINTHGHFDHAGGSAFFQNAYDARIVMTEQDWQLVEAEPDVPMFYSPVPQRDIVAKDGDVIELGDTRVELFHTPGHTEGVLTLRYTVKDGARTYTAITLGGVGLNFSGVERTQTYLDSYARIQAMQDGVSVSLPNHAAMGNVLGRAEQLGERKPGEPHTFVDPEGYKASIATFIANAEQKLEQEKAGTAADPMDELTKALDGEE